jgi:hypothetical protein
MSGAVRPVADDRAAYLAEVSSLLWPAPAAAVRKLLVVPSLRDPRLLIPAERRAAAAAVRRYGEPASVRTRVGGRVLQLALAAGAGQLLLRDRLTVAAGADTIDGYIGRQLGRDVVPSMHLGAPRANRKPVLQLLTRDGTTVAFAKVGTTALTSALVRAERAALDRVAAAGLRSVTAPAVRHLGDWHGLDVLILDALPVWQPRRELAAGQLEGAMAEVARLAGSVSASLADSGYVHRLAGRLAAAPDTADRRAVEELLAGLAGPAAGRVLEFGAWHGDWTPWNMATTAGGLLLWDWERFAARVPVGFDALHYWLQSAVVTARTDPAAAAGQCLERAPELLRPFGVDAPAARLTARLYLCELSARYLADRQAEAGARLGAPGRWLIPALAGGAR